jgi:hypothetical protein
MRALSIRHGRGEPVVRLCRVDSLECLYNFTYLRQLDGCTTTDTLVSAPSRASDPGSALPLGFGVLPAIGRQHRHDGTNLLAVQNV